MAAAPVFKVYRNGEYIGCCKHPEDAAALVGMSGGEVRYGHSRKWTLWTDGSEDGCAGDSYDDAAKTMLSRLEQLIRDADEKRARQLRPTTPADACGRA